MPGSFQYVGRTALHVRGPVTGNTYHFATPGTILTVDGRDVLALLSLPNLKRVH